MESILKVLLQLLLAGSLMCISCLNETVDDGSDLVEPIVDKWFYYKKVTMSLDTIKKVKHIDTTEKLVIENFMNNDTMIYYTMYKSSNDVEKDTCVYSINDSLLIIKYFDATGELAEMIDNPYKFDRDSLITTETQPINPSDPNEYRKYYYVRYSGDLP